MCYATCNPDVVWTVWRRECAESEVRWSSSSSPPSMVKRNAVKRCRLAGSGRGRLQWKCCPPIHNWCAHMGRPYVMPGKSAHTHAAAAGTFDGCGFDWSVLHTIRDPFRAGCGDFDGANTQINPFLDWPFMTGWCGNQIEGEREMVGMSIRPHTIRIRITTNGCSIIFL